MREETELYRKMYTVLFNAVTDALELIGNGENSAAAVKLATAQYESECIYINYGE